MSCPPTHLVWKISVKSCSRKSTREVSLRISFTYTCTTTESGPFSYESFLTNARFTMDSGSTLRPQLSATQDRFSPTAVLFPIHPPTLQPNLGWVPACPLTAPPLPSTKVIASAATAISSLERSPFSGSLLRAMAGETGSLLADTVFSPAKSARFSSEPKRQVWGFSGGTRSCSSASAYLWQDRVQDQL